MIRNVYTRLAIIGGLLLISFISLYPTMVPKDPATGEAILPEWWLKIKSLPTKRIKLGLDLRGGVYLVYTVKLDQAVVLEAQHLVETLANEALEKEEGVKVADSNVDEKGVASVTFADEASFQKGGKLAKQYFENDWSIKQDGDNPLKMFFEMKQASVKKYRDDAIQQVRRTVASRIDKWGVAEVGIQVKLPDQLIVELPGIEETGRIEKIINAQANLQLKLVKDSGASEEDIKQKKGGKLSPLEEVLANKDATGVIEEYLLVSKKADITGDCIANARQAFGGDFGQQAVVNFTLKGGDNCAGKFARLTGSNIGNRLAIVLDDEVFSAPVIRARIKDSGVIEGNFNVNSANDLSIVLKAGSLRVPVVKDRVESIGPSLGGDHIRSGKIAMALGSGLVVLFMFVYYKFCGLAANISLIANIFFIMAALATFGATLTFPGIAGIILTIGMAVDANVLVYERIREELRTGKTPRASVELGYSRALATILDANITTFLTAAVLYVYGTGPIKGFAVTLMFGIVFSVFTAIFISRTIIDMKLESDPHGELSI